MVLWALQIQIKVLEWFIKEVQEERVWIVEQQE